MINFSYTYNIRRFAKFINASLWMSRKRLRRRNLKIKIYNIYICVYMCIHTHTHTHARARARVITTLGSIIFPFVIFSFLRSLHVYNTYKISRLRNRWKARIGMSVTLLLVKSLKQFKSWNRVNKRFIKLYILHGNIRS